MPTVGRPASFAAHGQHLESLGLPDHSKLAFGATGSVCEQPVSLRADVVGADAAATIKDLGVCVVWLRGCACARVCVVWFVFALGGTKSEWSGFMRSGWEREQSACVCVQPARPLLAACWCLLVLVLLEPEPMPEPNA